MAAMAAAASADSWTAGSFMHWLTWFIPAKKIADLAAKLLTELQTDWDVLQTFLAFVKTCANQLTRFFSPLANL